MTWQSTFSLRDVGCQASSTHATPHWVALLPAQFLSFAGIQVIAVTRTGTESKSVERNGWACMLGCIIRTKYLAIEIRETRNKRALVTTSSIKIWLKCSLLYEAFLSTQALCKHFDYRIYWTAFHLPKQCGLMITFLRPFQYRPHVLQASHLQWHTDPSVHQPKLRLTCALEGCFLFPWGLQTDLAWATHWTSVPHSGPQPLDTSSSARGTEEWTLTDTVTCVEDWSPQKKNWGNHFWFSTWNRFKVIY